MKLLENKLKLAEEKYSILKQKKGNIWLKYAQYHNTRITFVLEKEIEYSKRELEEMSSSLKEKKIQWQLQLIDQSQGKIINHEQLNF